MRILSIVTRPESAPRTPTPEEIERGRAIISDLASKGALIDAGGTWPGLLEMQITRRAGNYSIVDGPFSEAKEIVGGYVLIDVPDREAAIAVARRFLDASGDGTFHLHEIVENPLQTIDIRIFDSRPSRYQNPK
jgi:hypothetical protein